MSKEHILKILLYRQSISFMLIISKFTETTPKSKKKSFLIKVLQSQKQILHLFQIQGCCTYIKVEKAENSIVAHI